MPGEYGEDYGEWSFDSLNAEGYVAETSFSNENHMTENGYATVYGYANSPDESRLELHTAGINEALKKISVGYSLKINGGDGLRLSLGATTDNSEKQLLSYEISDGNATVFCEDEQIYSLKTDEWNRYLLEFDLQNGTVDIYIDSALVKTVSLSAEAVSSLNKISFTFKSENFEDCYSIDEVAIIY